MHPNSNPSYKIESGFKEVNVHCNPVQGQYRASTGFSLCSKFSQGKTCVHYREALFSLQGPCIHHRESCIHYREFPVRITTQGNPCNHYREWVCSVGYSEKLWAAKIRIYLMKFGHCHILVSNTVVCSVWTVIFSLDFEVKFITYTCSLIFKTGN